MTASRYPILIGFGYKARRGKDTCAKAILQERGGQYDIRHYAFGDKLREEVEAAAFDAWAQEYPNKPISSADPREVALNLCDRLNLPFDPDAQVEPGYPFTKQRALYQWWGTELRRKQDAFYWVKELRKKIERDNPQFALITDVRFRNEVAFIRSMEGFTVHVERPGLEEPLSSSQSKHVSEVELDNAPDSIWTHHIVGKEADVEDLRRQAVAVFDDIVHSLTCPEIEQLLALHPELFTEASPQT